MSRIRVDFYKVIGLPSEPQPNSFYLVENDGVAELYVTDIDGNAKPIGNSDVINALIAEHADTITSENALGHVRIDGETIVADEDGVISATRPVTKVANEAERLGLVDPLFGTRVYQDDIKFYFELINEEAPGLPESWRVIPRVYKAFVSQNSFDDPVAIEIENTIGTSGWSRFGEGQYYLERLGDFPLGRTVVSPNQTSGINDASGFFWLIARHESGLGIAVTVVDDKQNLLEWNVSDFLIIVEMYPPADVGGDDIG